MNHLPGKRILTLPTDVRLRVKDGLIRVRMIVAPDKQMEKRLFEAGAVTRAMEKAEEEIRDETDWFAPRIEAFHEDAVLRRRVDEMTEYLMKPSCRVYVRRFLLTDGIFHRWQSAQCAVMQSAGASDVLIHKVTAFQSEARRHFLSRKRFQYPSRVEIEKMLTGMRRLVQCARSLLANEFQIAEINGAVGHDLLTLSSIVINAVMGREGLEAVALLLAHHHHSQMRPSNRLLNKAELLN